VKIKTHFIHTVTPSKNRAVYETWKSMVQPHMTGIRALYAG